MSMMTSSRLLIGSCSRQGAGLRRWSSQSGSLRGFSSHAWTQQLVAADGVDVNVSLYNFDAHKTAVLCLPGALGTGPSDFEAILNGGLGDSIGVVAMDPRGLGGVSGVERDFPLDFYVRDALDGAAVMQQLGVNRYSVLGWSDGANSAIHLAARRQENVDKLVVWGGNAYVTKEDVDAWEAVRDVKQSWSPRMRDDKAKIHGGVDKLQHLNDRATDGWIRLFTEGAGDVCLSALHQVTCPTMVLHGAKDVICSMTHARYIAKQISDVTLTVFPEGKHNLHQRHADAFHEVVKDFLLGSSGSDHDQDDNHSSTLPEPAIDQIAYAFMGSKALSTALKAGVFDAIASATADPSAAIGATFQDIEQQSEVQGERLRTLLSACVSLNVIRRKVKNGQDFFTLPQASHDQLVKSSKHYWGDYISNQVDAQFYNRMEHLDTVLRTGDTAKHGYEAWFEADPEAARKYTEAQHNGSLATAYALHRRLPELATRFPNLRMLDVGGGSGAFSIATARKIEHAECVVLDLPNVTQVAADIIATEEESVKERLSTLSLSANDPGRWHGIVEDESYDVVLMSYISGSIPVVALPGLYQNAFRVLKPGGVAILHDFFVDNDGAGPTNAALWALAHTTVNPDGMGLRPSRIVEMLTQAGFVAPKVESLIPKTTQTIVATKPATKPISKL
ncbi:Valacyclovir hydrolase [Seminavis robusta]|uniref:Valacyclovir hydrolase n=1 Tax=Seminavis robusta TaxID=568900 RepID=A0A9N8EUW4_9STRA|nr:Valacyclovir hydrolase [Seminavis robusta]|eukprot:Sro1758_g295710.1 Valacyclovir hydrolase (675) ;mRNA; f:3818-6103